MMKNTSLTLILAAVVLGGVNISCKEPSEQKQGKDKGKMELKIESEKYGEMPDGREVTLFTLTNANGMKVKLTNYGAITVAVETPDKKGEIADVTLGYETLDDWLGSKDYFGATVGRYANRIAKGKFTLEGETYELATNNGPNHLHGGEKGFDKVLWDAEEVKTEDSVGVKFTYLSEDGEEGYPGNLKVTATYTLNNDNEFTDVFTASTDKPTVVNLTNHTYWNLGTPAAGDVLDHVLMLNADHYTPVDETLIPTGEIKPVEGTPFDFAEPTAIGARIDKVEGGYDHNFCLNNQSGQMILAARVKDPDTGRVMEIHTDQPGIQFYSGNFLDGSVTGKNDIAYKKHYGFCLETQHYPDSPNQEKFPSTVLRPGETYRHKTIHKFTVETE